MAGRFQTTRWTLVLEAGHGEDTQARAALESLCEAYWYPLYEFVRRQGRSADEAADLVQGYFALLLEKKFLARVDPHAGRFRSFLLTTLKHYMYNEYDKARRLKRGGNVTHISIDGAEAEQRYAIEPTDSRTPEDAFVRRWALTVTARALARLEDEQSTEDQRRRFYRLKAYVTGDGPKTSYAEAAADLGVSEPSVRVAVHRLRTRFGASLRQEIANTVRRPDDIDSEIRCLIEALQGRPSPG